MARQILALILSISLLSGLAIQAAEHSRYIPITNESLLPQRYDIQTDGEKLIIEHYLKPGFVVFDVGAASGEWSLLALEAEPRISLFCFEPTLSSFHQLTNNLTKHPASVYNFALSDEVGEKTFYQLNANQSEGNSLFYRECFNNRKMQKLKIFAETLDHFCEMNHTNRIDFLKIDAEGSELQILKGGKDLLHDQKITALQFEYGGSFQDSHTTLKEVMTLLTQSGYSIFRITYEGLLHIPQWTSSLENYEYANFFSIIQSEMPEFSCMKDLDSL